MSNRVSILLNPDKSIAVANGDLVLGDTDGQDGQLILLSNPGSWRQNPLVGIGIRQMVNSKLSALTVLSLKKQIRLQYSNNGWTISALSIPAIINTNLSNITIQYQ